MCVPSALAALGLVAGGAGSIMSAAGANSAAGAAARDIRKETKRQNGYRRAAGQAFNNELAGWGLPLQEGALAADKAVQGARIGAAVNPVEGTYIPVAPGAPDAVKAEIARRMVGAIDHGKATAQQLADLSAFGNVMQDNRRAMSDAERRIATQGSFARGSASVLPYRLNADQYQGSGLRTFGDILGGVGTLAGDAAAVGYGPSWDDIGGWFGGAALPAVPHAQRAGF